MIHFIEYLTNVKKLIRINIIEKIKLCPTNKINMFYILKYEWKCKKKLGDERKNLMSEIDFRVPTHKNCRNSK